ncbi:MAG: hypothetical protein U9P72_11080 [Campylobacterota bacterium]|nr:hypothetical protein [Campylobacterota bacterium]
MQRSITNKKSLESFIYIILFIIYESLSSIYLFLPPLFAVLFVLFARALDRENTVEVFLIAFCLVIFEADKSYLLFSSIIYFLLIYKFITPKLKQNFGCTACINFTYVLLAYVGFFLFSLILAKVFILPVPSINYYIIYYIVIEFFIVSVL